MAKIIDFGETTACAQSSGMSPVDLVTQMMRSSLDHHRVVQQALGAYISNIRYLKKRLEANPENWSEEGRAQVVIGALDAGIQLTIQEYDETGELISRYTESMTELEYGCFDTAIELLQESAINYRDQAINDPDMAFQVRKAAIGDDDLVRELEVLQKQLTTTV